MKRTDIVRALENLAPTCRIQRIEEGLERAADMCAMVNGLEHRSQMPANQVVLK